ncbi:hypothetical protein [Amycolatopsis anabasis]|uniref:hypothetical protein n=1 Tax=Amycolatopsis anabasis TaxID=1840409 RepID=UPI00131B2144|nr:hypothetical protein [Amycolatopsis anabasis]
MDDDSSFAVTTIGFRKANWGDGQGLRTDTSRLLPGGLPIRRADALGAREPAAADEQPVRRPA